MNAAQRRKGLRAGRRAFEAGTVLFQALPDRKWREGAVMSLFKDGRLAVDMREHVHGEGCWVRRYTRPERVRFIKETT